MASAPQVAVVTGANQGIGFEIARGLATAPGFHCILTARDEDKGRAAVARLLAEATGARVSFHQLDVTDPASVDRLADHVRTAHGGRLAVLVNNAGLAFKGDTWGAAEARATVGVNVYGTRRVTEALLPFVKAAAGGTPGGSRIINVCSQAGRLGQVAPPLQAAFQNPHATPDSVGALMEDFIGAVADGSYAARGWPRSMYGVSKLGEIAYTYCLASALAHDGVLVAAVCPGHCATAMSSFSGARSPAQGADTVLFLATERDLKPGDVTGGLWFDRHLIPW